MAEKVYHISDAFIKNKKDTFLIFRITISLFIILLFSIPFYILREIIPLWLMIFSLIFSITILQLISSFFFFFILNRLKQIKIIIKDNNLQKISGETIIKEIVLDKNLNLMKVNNKKSEIINLKISNKYNTTNIYGYDNIKQLFNNIIQAGNIENIKEKTTIFDYSKPSIHFMFIIIGIVLYLIILGFQVLNSFFSEEYYKIIISKLINIIIPVSLGLFILIFRPISKTLGKKYQIFEIIGSIILILLFVLQLFF